MSYYTARMNDRNKTAISRFLILLAAFALGAGPVDARPGVLTAAPEQRPAPAQPAAPGLLRLPDGALAYLPASADRARPLPMLLLLPGTGGVAREMIDAVRAAADRHGVLLLAVRPRGENWDAVDSFFDAYEARSEAGRSRWPVPRFGADARRVDAALAALFARVPVDPGRIGVLGFSHGASYALSLGAANPRLFSTIIALSPGILVLPEAPAAGQQVYLSHGTRDRVQPYRRTRSSFVPRLLALGFRVTFRPFEGGHALPDATVAESVRLFAGAPAR